MVRTPPPPSKARRLELMHKYVNIFQIINLSVQLYIALVDESGKGNCNQKGPFVLSASIIEDVDIALIENKFEKTKFMNLPGISPKTEIHAKEIVHGENEYRKYTQPQRKYFLDELYKIVSSLNLTIIGVVIEKNDCKNMKMPSGPQLKAKEISYEKLAITLITERLTLFMKKIPDGRLLIVMDEGEFSHDKKLSQSTSEEIEKGLYTSAIAAKSRIFSKPLFLRSDVFLPLQLADLVSYAIFKKYSMPITSMFDFSPWFTMLEGKFDRCPRGGYLNCGLKKWYS